LLLKKGLKLRVTYEERGAVVRRKKVPTIKRGKLGKGTLLLIEREKERGGERTLRGEKKKAELLRRKGPKR